MPDSPKIILNDDYLDLREKNNKETFNKKRNTLSLKNEGPKPEKELLKNLQNYLPHANHKITLKKKNAFNHDPRFRKLVEEVNNKSRFNSQSECLFSPKKINVDPVCPSSPQILRPLNARNADTLKSLLDELNDNDFDDKNEEKDELFEFEEDNTFDLSVKNESFSQTNDRDPRLKEKYSVLNLPWRRTWTLPVIARPSEINLEKNKKAQEAEDCDIKTYKYDDGTDVESVTSLKMNTAFKVNKSVNSYVMMGLFFCGSLFGLVLVSFAIWVMIVTNTIPTIFKGNKADNEGLSNNIYSLQTEENSGAWSYW